MYGLSNSTALKTIKLSNIQEMHGAYSTFNFTWFLEPVKNCPIRLLHLAYNAFEAIYPGINRYASQLEYIDVSNNFLAPLLTFAFFIETLLHKGLKETDFKHQSFIDYGRIRNKKFRKEQTVRVLGLDAIIKIRCHIIKRISDTAMLFAPITAVDVAQETRRSYGSFTKMILEAILVLNKHEVEYLFSRTITPYEIFTILLFSVLICWDAHLPDKAHVNYSYVLIK